MSSINLHHTHVIHRNLYEFWRVKKVCWTVYDSVDRTSSFYQEFFYHLNPNKFIYKENDLIQKISSKIRQVVPMNLKVRFCK